MSAPEPGWAWLDGSGAPALEPDAEADLARRTARLFATPDGEMLLCHLERLTLRRCLAPEAGDGALRHLEGQRHLVLHLHALIIRGRG